MKYLIYSACLGISLLAVATIGLVKMNWSEKVYSPLISLLFVGVLTTFITVWLTLKETKDEAVFTTGIVINEMKHSLTPPHPDSKDRKLAWRLEDLSNLSNPYKVSAGKAIYTVERPTTSDETVSFCGELLQYKILTEIESLQHDEFTMSETIEAANRARVSTSFLTPYKLSERTKIPTDELFIIVAGNRFSNSDNEVTRWKHISFDLPPGTQLTLVHVPLSKHTKVEQHIITLEKPYFFKIEIAIESFGALGVGAIPDGLTLSADDKAEVSRNYLFKITMRAKFDKLSSGNWQTEEYKAWAKWMFAEIQDRISDSPRPQ